MEDLDLMDLQAQEDVLWEGFNHIWGFLPFRIDRYRLTRDRLFVETGISNIEEEQIVLYRVQDLHLKMSIWQRMLNVGNVQVYSTDKTNPVTELKNIRYPRRVRELIHRQVEDARIRRKFRLMEMIKAENGDDDPALLEMFDQPEGRKTGEDAPSANPRSELDELDGNT